MPAKEIAKRVRPAVVPAMNQVRRESKPLPPKAEPTERDNFADHGIEADAYDLIQDMRGDGRRDPHW